MTTSFTKDDSRDVVVTYGGKFEISRSLLPSWDIGHERVVGILRMRQTNEIKILQFGIV